MNKNKVKRIKVIRRGEISVNGVQKTTRGDREKSGTPIADERLNDLLHRPLK